MIEPFRNPKPETLNPKPVSSPQLRLSNLQIEKGPLKKKPLTGTLWSPRICGERADGFRSAGQIPRLQFGELAPGLQNPTSGVANLKPDTLTQRLQNPLIQEYTLSKSYLGSVYSLMKGFWSFWETLKP